jgi:hypothetical protein
MVLPKFVLDASTHAKRTKIAASDGDIARTCAAADLRRDVAMKLPKAENLASWENEGDASAPGLNVVQPSPGREGRPTPTAGPPTHTRWQSCGSLCCSSFPRSVAVRFTGVSWWGALPNDGPTYSRRARNGGSVHCQRSGMLTGRSANHCSRRERRRWAARAGHVIRADELPCEL